MDAYVILAVTDHNNWHSLRKFYAKYTWERADCAVCITVHQRPQILMLLFS